MKLKAMLAAGAVALTGWLQGYAQDAGAEVPGDHFSLEGALELFKKSQSPEEFERLLNSKDSKVNNLDLNGDGYIDYIRVFDRQEGNVHVFILQAVVTDSENQDIAVIELEKLADGKAVLQIVGDPDIYGIETIIEPTSEVRTYAGSMREPVVVNVWAWPVVRYVYGPSYVVYRSPWGWRHRPIWWSPWRPIVYVDYYSYWEPYYPHYSFCYTRRVTYAYNIYRPYRCTSVVVVNRYRPQMEKFRSRYADGHKRNSRSSSLRDREAGGRTSRGGAIGSNSDDRGSLGRSSRSASRSASGNDLRQRGESGAGRSSTTSGGSRSLTRDINRDENTSVPSRSASYESSSRSQNRPAEIRRRESSTQSGVSGSGSSRSIQRSTRESAPAVSPSRSSNPSRSSASPSRSGSPRQSVTPSRNSSPSRQSASPGSSSPSRQSASPARQSSPTRSSPSRSSGGSRSGRSNN